MKMSPKENEISPYDGYNPYGDANPFDIQVLLNRKYF